MSYSVGMTETNPPPKAGVSREKPDRRAPLPLNEGRSRNMSANRRTNTKPELALRSALHGLGYRFRKDLRLEVPGLKVRPDIVFTRLRVAVFVDGCFWHACPEHGRPPTRNEWYWSPKLQRNVERDAEVTEGLESAGWHVIRVWEHVPLTEAVSVVEDAVHERRAVQPDPRLTSGSTGASTTGSPARATRQTRLPNST